MEHKGVQNQALIEYMQRLQNLVQQKISEPSYHFR